MAPSGGAVLSFQLCVFDMRRGQEEGHEIEKILFYFPLDCPLSTQLSVIGLSEGLITFSRIFSPNAPCEFMDARKHSHIFYQCEPDIWMVMVVEKNKEEDLVTRDDALRALLRGIHRLFMMFYGSLHNLLAEHPTGDVARRCLYAFLSDYIADFIVGKNSKLPTIFDSLTEPGAASVLDFERDALLDAQSLVNLLESWFGGGTIRHTLLLFHSYLISSSLSPDDTAVLFSYAIGRMTPEAILQSKKSYFKTSAAVLNNVVSSFISETKQSHMTSDAWDEPEASALQGAESPRIPRPFLQDAWWQESDGFLSTVAWGQNRGGGAVVPTIRLQESNEPLQLCVFHQKSLTLIMLVPTNTSINGFEGISLLKKQFIEKASYKAIQLEERLTREWGGSNSTHVPGYRYMIYDLANKLMKASPVVKVATLSKDSLATLNKVREEVDLEKSRAARAGLSTKRDLEICIRAKNNAWVVVRRRGNHELYVILERASDTLLLASETIEKFSKRYCEGKFSSD